MAGRHEGKADSLAVIVGVPLGILGFLAFLAWLIYLMTSAQTSRLSLVIIGSIAVLVWVAALVIKWREDKRFPLFIALAVTPVFNLAHLLTPLLAVDQLGGIRRRVRDHLDLDRVLRPALAAIPDGAGPESLAFQDREGLRRRRKITYEFPPQVNAPPATPLTAKVTVDRNPRKREGWSNAKT